MMRAFFKTVVLLPALLLAAACGGKGGVATCNSAADCATGESCVSGVCTLGSSDGGNQAAAGALGAACTSKADCNTGLSCLTATADGFPGGYCSTACGSGACSSGTCADLSSTEVAGSACENTCSSSASCRSGYVCCSSFGGGACTPSAYCPAGSAPTVSVGVNTFPTAKPTSCSTPVIAAPTYASGVGVQKLGTKSVGQKVNFNVPAGTGSISIVSQSTQTVTANPTYVFKQSGQSYTLDNGVIPDLLTTPSGDVWFEDNFSPELPDGGEDTNGADYHAYYGTLNLIAEATTSVLTLPNSSQGITDSKAGYPAGQWSFVVNDDRYECAEGEFTDPADGISCTGGSDGGTYDLTVLTKPATPATGKLDISIYLVGNTLTAAVATSGSNTHVTRFISDLTSLYAGLGICINSITFYDVPTWAKSAYGGLITSQGKLVTGDGAPDAAHTGTCDNLDQMFTLAKVGTNTLNFFFVDSILDNGAEPTSGEVVVGIDGAIPGPSGFSGTVHAGAVVNASDILSGTCVGALNPNGSCGADLTAYIAAHEGGHWMGLYHPTEGYGQAVDPLDDTPTCACSAACGLSASQVACCINPATGGFTGTCSSMTPTDLSGTVCTKNQTTCGGADYLMFFIIDTPSKGTVSPEQGEIARSNLVVY